MTRKLKDIQYVLAWSVRTVGAMWFSHYLSCTEQHAHDGLRWIHRPATINIVCVPLQHFRHQFIVLIMVLRANIQNFLAAFRLSCQHGWLYLIQNSKAIWILHSAPFGVSGWSSVHRKDNWRIMLVIEYTHCQKQKGNNIHCNVEKQSRAKLSMGINGSEYKNIILNHG